MLLELFILFCKIGAFTLGGGYAMIPLIQSEFVDKRGWFEKDEFLDILAISQSTPGALAVNMSISIGYRKKGIWGAVFATLGCVLPSFFSILIIAIFFNQFINFRIVEKAFLGIRPAVSALIVFSVLNIGRTSKITYYWYLIVPITVILIVFLKVDPILIILFVSLISAIYAKFRSDKNENS